MLTSHDLGAAANSQTLLLPDNMGHQLGTATATAPVNEQSSGTASMRDGLVAEALACGAAA